MRRQITREEAEYAWEKERELSKAKEEYLRVLQSEQNQNDTRKVDGWSCVTMYVQLLEQAHQRCLWELWMNAFDDYSVLIIEYNPEDLKQCK